MALAAWALLTLEDAKAYLGLSGVDKEDAAVSDLIEAASLLCEDETDRLLKSRALAAEVYDGDAGRCELRLRQYPVTAVTALSFWDGTGWAAQDMTALGLFIKGPLSNRIALRNGAFPRGWQNVEVSYTAGFVTVPAKIRQACREALMVMYKSRDRQLANIASQTFPGGQTVTYRTGYLTQEIKDLLGPYARSTA